MRLLSLNVALFETNNKQLYEFLLQQKPDIVCLQEVATSSDLLINKPWDYFTSQNKDYLSKDYIDKATKELRYSVFDPTWLSHDFHQKNFHQKEDYFIDFGGWIESGIYIKTRFKITKSANIFLKHKLEKITNWTIWPKNEAKSVQIVDLKTSHGKLRIVNYHGIWTKEKIGNYETLKACKKINQLATAVDYPVIITGDFNLFPDTESMKVFQNRFISLVDKYNIKTTRPKTNELSYLKRNSDHLPLVLDFDT